MPIFPPGDSVWNLLREPHYMLRPHVFVYDLVNAGLTGLDLDDYLTRFSLSYSIDNAAGQATFSFARGSGSTSLSPLMSSSSLTINGIPALDPNHGIFLWVGIQSDPFTEIGVPALFQGRIDSVDIASSETEVTIQCRDVMGILLNMFIEETGIYGSTGGTDVEDVIRDIMTANGVPGGHLVVTGATGFPLFPFAQEPMSLGEAVRINAQKVGWDLRAFPGDVELFRLYDPGRLRTNYDDEFDTSQYRTITELSYSDADVRNYWIGYWEGDDGIIHGPIGPVVDQASIDRYGKRFAQIYVRRAEGIRSDGALTTLLNAALADSRVPLASHSIEMPFYPNVLLNDIHLYHPNGIEYNDFFQCTVVGYTHSWHATQTGESPESAVALTTITARETPMAAYREYRRSVQPEVFVALDVQPTDLPAAEGTIALQVDDLSVPVALMRDGARRMGVSRERILKVSPYPQNTNLVIAGVPIHETE